MLNTDLNFLGINLTFPSVNINDLTDKLDVINNRRGNKSLQVTSKNESNAES